MQCQRNQAADLFDNLHRTGFVEHHQTGFDTANQCRNTVESLRSALRYHALAESFLDSSEIDDALAHDRFGDLLIVGIVFFRTLGLLPIRPGLNRNNQFQQLLIEPVLDTQQG